MRGARRADRGAPDAGDTAARRPAPPADGGGGCPAADRGGGARGLAVAGAGRTRALGPFGRRADGARARRTRQHRRGLPPRPPGARRGAARSRAAAAVARPHAPTGRHDRARRRGGRDRSVPRPPPDVGRARPHAASRAAAPRPDPDAPVQGRIPDARRGQRATAEAVSPRPRGDGAAGHGPGQRRPAAGTVRHRGVARRLLDRPARGHEPGVQGVRGSGRLPEPGVLAGALRRRRPHAVLAGRHAAVPRQDRPARSRDLDLGNLPCRPCRLPRRRRELVRSRGLRGLRRRASADDPPLVPGGGARPVRRHPHREQLQRQRTGGRRQLRWAGALRHSGHGRQREGMVLDGRRRPADAAGRELGRTRNTPSRTTTRVIPSSAGPAPDCASRRTTRRCLPRWKDRFASMPWSATAARSGPWTTPSTPWCGGSTPTTICRSTRSWKRPKPPNAG